MSKGTSLGERSERGVNVERMYLNSEVSEFHFTPPEYGTSWV